MTHYISAGLKWSTLSTRRSTLSKVYCKLEAMLAGMKIKAMQLIETRAG